MMNAPRYREVTQSFMALHVLLVVVEMRPQVGVDDRLYFSCVSDPLVRSKKSKRSAASRMSFVESDDEAPSRSQWILVAIQVGVFGRKAVCESIVTRPGRINGRLSHVVGNASAKPFSSIVVMKVIIGAAS